MLKSRIRLEYGWTWPEGSDFMSGAMLTDAEVIFLRRKLISLAKRGDIMSWYIQPWNDYAPHPNYSAAIAEIRDALL